MSDIEGILIVEMDIDDYVCEDIVVTNVDRNVSISLHPLVILNISEHWTRLTMQENSLNPMIGALIGKHNGQTIEIMNSFEMLYTVGRDGNYVIDRNYYNTKEEQFKQVFCDMEFLGWYLTGTGSDQPTFGDILVQKQIIDIVECPIFLKMNDQGGHNNFPIKIYESVIDKDLLDSKMKFNELKYTLSSDDSERIGIDHVSRMSSDDTQENSLVADILTVQFNAIKMLHCKVKMVLEYLKNIKDTGNCVSYEILRELYSLCHQLPVMESVEFYKDLYSHLNDVALIAYLGVLTKCTKQFHDVCNRYNLMHSLQIFGNNPKTLPK